MSLISDKVKVLLTYKIKLSLHTSQVTHYTGAYPGFSRTKQIEVFLLPLDGMLVHRRVTPFKPLSEERHHEIKLSCPRTQQNVSSQGSNLDCWLQNQVWDLSFLPTDKTNCPRSGFEPRPFTSESRALTMRPPPVPPTLITYMCNLRKNFWDINLKKTDI